MDTSFGHPFPARINSLTYDPLGAVFIDTSLGTILANTAVPGLDLNYNGYASGESPCDEASVMESFERRLTLYPSPSDGILNIEIPGRYAGSFDIRIFDIFGQVLREERLFLPGQTNLSNLSPGIYFIEARNKVETMTRKFVLL
jgi:hypothetical protein